MSSIQSLNQLSLPKPFPFPIVSLCTRINGREFHLNHPDLSAQMASRVTVGANGTDPSSTYNGTQWNL